MKHYWLMKSEPESYGIRHLQNDTTTAWTGVRNFQARNFMKAMQVGDTVLFYHSNCKEPGIYGIAEVVSTPYPDETQFDPASRYFERRATSKKPLWELVDIAFVKELSKPVLLSALRTNERLARMRILEPGSRLSVTPVTKEEFKEIERMAR